MKNGSRVIKIKEETHLKIKYLQQILLTKEIKISYDEIISELLDEELKKCEKYYKVEI